MYPFFEAENPSQGFDDFAKWQYIPLYDRSKSFKDNERILVLNRAPAFSVSVADPTLVNLVDLSMYPDRKRFSLHSSNQIGKTTLDVKDAQGNMVLQWTVEVVPKIVTIVETHLVHGKQGGTRQTGASLQVIRKEVNAILQPQANVELDFFAGDPVEHRGMESLNMTYDPATRRQVRQYGRQISHLSKVTGSFSSAHAFFVSKILGVSRRTADGGPLGIAPTKTPSPIMVVEDMDDPKQMGLVLAHEFFHAITRTKHLTNPRTSRNDLLMWTDNYQGFTPGTYLTQHEIEKLRKCA
jgi:hypothetical protein